MNFSTGPIGESLLAWSAPEGHRIGFLDSEGGTAVFEEMLEHIEANTPLRQGTDIFVVLDMAHWPEHVDRGLKAAMQKGWPNVAIAAWQDLAKDLQE